MVILVRFGEIALKSRYVRRQLRNRLVANIQDRFAADGVECVTEADEARVYVHTDDPDRARGLLERVFGVVSMSPAAETRADIASLQALAVEEASRAVRPEMSFALRPRRVGTHPFTSQDLAREIGAAIQQAIPGAVVNLSRPDVAIHIEARHARGFVFRDTWKGPGGLPLGSQGRALAYVPDERGMVAAWLGMKRGCRIAVGAPEEGPAVEALRRWDTHLKVLRATSHADLGELARAARAEAVYLGTRWSEFDAGRRPVLPVPIFEPLIGLTDADLARLAKRIVGA